MRDIRYIVMPAYNEAANIEEVISQWHPVCEKINAEGNMAKLVIANDGSKDNTFQIMLQLQGKYPFFVPIDKINSGHGAAVSAIAVKKNEKIAWCPIIFRSRQGDVNSINMRRFFKIGVKALGDFKRINRRSK